MEPAGRQLAVVERDGGIAIYALGASGWSREALGASGRWPAVSPRGDLVAVAAAALTQRGTASSLDLVPLPGSQARGSEAYRSPPGGPALIAPRVPNYASWSPDGSLIAIVGQSEGGLALMVSAADGLFAADRVLGGAPIFFAWSPDSRWLCVHTSEEAVLVSLEPSRERTVLASPGGGFRAPCFTRDGRFVVFARPAPPGAALFARDMTTGAEEELARFAGGIALAPTGPAVSVAVTRNPDAGTFDELWLVDPAHRTKDQLLASGPFAAVFWSPDGEQAALMVPLQSGDGRYAVTVRDRLGAYVAATEPFVPSQDYRTIVGFFDQYGASHPLWSADSALFTLTGRAGGDGPPSAFADGPLDTVFAWRTAPREPLVPLTGGDIGFFAPPHGHPPL